jgi:membrane protein implicated in regulation of membrane protease activity
MTWILTILSVIGVIANIYKKQWCFIIWAFTNFTWAIVDFANGLPEQGVLFSIYFILAIWGLYQWRKKKKT